MNINTLEPNVNNNYLTPITTADTKSKTSDTADNYISDNKNVSSNVDRFSLSNDSSKGTGIYSPNEFINSNYEVSAVNDITPYAVTSKTIKITGYAQENSKWCLVACTKTALKFLGVNKTQSEIYKAAMNTDKVEEKGIYFSDANRAIKELSGKSFSISTNPTYSLISNRVDNENIVIMRGVKGNSTVEHALVCYGFESDPDNDSYTLKIYDPIVELNDPSSNGYGTLTCSKKSSTDYTINVGGKTTTYSATGYMYGK